MTIFCPHCGHLEPTLIETAMICALWEDWQGIGVIRRCTSCRVPYDAGEWREMIKLISKE